MTHDLGVWEPFTVDEVVALMRGTDVTWWLSGGQALDRFLGRATRPHGDTDISIRRDHLGRVAEQLGRVLDLKIARDGQLSELDAQHAATDDSVHGLWCRALDGGPWRVQISLEPCVGEEWIYRRDVRVRRPLADLIEEHAGVPCVRPEVQLLWKARDQAPKDEIDLANVLPELSDAARAWLAGAIALAHPESPWRDRIERV